MQTVLLDQKNYEATGGGLTLSGGEATQTPGYQLGPVKLHPERHGDLTVRVGGYSAQFVQLNAAAQDEIISRYV